MTLKRFGVVIASMFVVTAGIIGGSAVAQGATPTCQIVLISENSTAGPNYPVKVCNSGDPVFTNPGTGKRWVLVVDGGALPEHSTRIAPIAIAETKVIGK